MTLAILVSSFYRFSREFSQAHRRVFWIEIVLNKILKPSSWNLEPLYLLGCLKKLFIMAELKQLKRDDKTILLPSLRSSVSSIHSKKATITRKSRRKWLFDFYLECRSLLCQERCLLLIASNCLYCHLVDNVFLLLDFVDFFSSVCSSKQFSSRWKTLQRLIRTYICERTS